MCFPYSVYRGYVHEVKKRASKMDYNSELNLIRFGKSESILCPCNSLHRTCVGYLKKNCLTIVMIATFNNIIHVAELYSCHFTDSKPMCTDIIIVWTSVVKFFW